MKISVHPLDVGFDTKALRIPVKLPRSMDATIEVCYVGKDGVTGTVSGTREQVVSVLRFNGYEVSDEPYPPDNDKDDAVVKWALSFLHANLNDPEVEEMLNENKLTFSDVKDAMRKRGIET